VTAAPANNDWDRWNDDRDHTIAELKATRHQSVLHGQSGSRSSGEWSQAPDYGQSGCPRLARVAPYRDGRWFRPYWADLGFLEPGVGSVSLRPVVPLRQPAGLVARSCLRWISPALGASIRFFLRFWRKRFSSDLVLDLAMSLASDRPRRLLHHGGAANRRGYKRS